MPVTSNYTPLPEVAIVPSPMDAHYFQVTGLLPPRRKYLLDAIAQLTEHFKEGQLTLKCFIALAPILFALPLPPQVGTDERSPTKTDVLHFTTFRRRVSVLREKSATLKHQYLKDFLEEEYSALFYQKTLEYPPHWSVPSGELLEDLRYDLQRRTSNGVDVRSIAIYTTTELMEVMDKEDSFGIIPPASVEVKETNFALFFLDGDNGWRCDMFLLGGAPYALDSGAAGAIKSEWIKKEMVGKERTRDVALHEYESNVKEKTCLTRMESRVGPNKKDPQSMVVFGQRSSKQVSSYGHHSGLHSRGSKVLLAQEAIGSGIIAGINEYFIQPLFAGQLLTLIKECVDYGACIFPSLPPWTLASITKDYSNQSHKDVFDLVGGFIVWFHAGVGTLHGGGFVCSSHGCHIVPKDGHVLFLGTPALYHHSSPPTTTGTRCLLGVGLAARKTVITSLKKELIEVLKDKAAELMTSEEDISKDLITPVVEKFLAILNFTSKNKKRKV
jgi:hypothetical protein